MPDDRTSRLLDEFSDVTGAAPRPESPARRSVMRNRFPVATLTGASLVVVAVAVAAILVGRPGPAPVVGSSPSTAAVASAPATVASTAPSSPEPTMGPCDPAMLTARITSWEGAAGSRIADVSLTNRGAACVLDDLARPVLVDGAGTALISGKQPNGTHGLLFAGGAVLTTLVEASNYCGDAPVAPVTVGFVAGDGREILARPVSTTDATVPPCNGAGSPASIAMHPWAP